MKIITNNRPRLVMDWDQIPESVRLSDFDYLDDETGPGRDFIRYKGHWFDLDDMPLAPHALRMRGWIGYAPDTYFSGVAMRYTRDDPDRVIMATVFS